MPSGTLFNSTKKGKMCFVSLPQNIMWLRLRQNILKTLYPERLF